MTIKFSEPQSEMDTAVNLSHETETQSQKPKNHLICFFVDIDKPKRKIVYLCTKFKHNEYVTIEST